jgi:hypothetical protein
VTKFETTELTDLRFLYGDVSCLYETYMSAHRSLVEPAEPAEPADKETLRTPAETCRTATLYT